MRKKVLAVLLAASMAMQVCVPLQASEGFESAFTDEQVESEEFTEIPEEIEMFGDGVDAPENEIPFEGKETIDDNVNSDTVEEPIEIFDGNSSLEKIDLKNAQGGCGQGLTWKITENATGEYTLDIVGTGEMKDYTSRTEWDNYRSNITKVNISDGVSRIGHSAFEKFFNLQSINIPSSVTSIGDRAFEFCRQLNNVVIPDSVTTMGHGVFRWCSNLQSVKLSSNMTSIEAYMFEQCGSLSDFIIPQNVSVIGKEAFVGCSSLYSVDVPSGVTGIEYGTFYDCCSLEEITLPDGIISIGGNAFGNCNNLQSINIPDGVISLGGGALRGCSSLKSIDIPAGITTIENNLFSGCSNLLNINLLGDVTSIGDYAFGECSSLSSFDIPEKITAIPDGMFFKCGNLEAIEIPDGVTNIGKSAFKWCGKLQSINIPQGVTNIGAEAFSQCISVSNINIPEGINRIEDGVFESCLELQEINIPLNVTYIGEEAFSACSKLKDIKIPENVTFIGKSAFCTCYNLENIKIPDKVTRIEDECFYGCMGLTNIEIPEGVTSIGEKAFYWCSGLKEIKIPCSVESIGAYAFELGDIDGYPIYFYGDAPSFGENVFYRNKSTVYYPSGNTTWNNVIKKTYGGNITWVEWNPEAGEGFDDIDSVYPGTDTISAKNVSRYTGQFEGDFGLSVSFNKALNERRPFGEGKIIFWEKDSQKKLLEIKGDESKTTPSCFYTELNEDAHSTIGIQIDKMDALPPDKDIYVTLTDDVVRFEDNTCNGAVSAPEFWVFHTWPVDYLDGTNWDFSEKIPFDKYVKLFLNPWYAEVVKLIDDGTGGVCYGMSYAVAAYKNAYSVIREMAGEKGSLIKTNIDEISGLGVSIRDYVHYAHLYQYMPTVAYEKQFNKNDVQKIHDEIVKYLEGNGKPLVIGVRNNKGSGHELYPVAIKESSDENTCRVVVYDCNVPNYTPELKFYKKDGKWSEWEYKVHDCGNTSHYDLYEKKQKIAIYYNRIDSMLDTFVGGSENLFYDMLEEWILLMVPGGDELESLNDLYEIWPAKGSSGNDGYDGYWTRDEIISIDSAGKPLENITFCSGNDKFEAECNDSAELTFNKTSKSIEIDSNGAEPVKLSASTYQGDEMSVTTVQGMPGDGKVKYESMKDGYKINGLKDVVVNYKKGEEEQTLFTDELNSESNYQIKVDENDNVFILGDSDDNGTFDKVIASTEKTNMDQTSVAAIPNQTYAGAELTPVPVITYNGVSLVKDVDFTVEYSNNNKPGTARITIKGIGKYTGSIVVTFEIVEATGPVDPTPPIHIPTPTPLPDNYPDGSYEQADGSIKTPDGTVIDKDGTITLPDGTILKPDADGNKPTIDKDNTVTDTNGTKIYKDGTIVLPGEDRASEDDDTTIGKNTGDKRPVYKPDNVTVITEEGNKITLPSGKEITPPAGSIVQIDGTVTEPDGTVIDPDGTTYSPDGSIQAPDGSYRKPAKAMIKTVNVAGNIAQTVLEAECAGAKGYDFVIGKKKDMLTTKDYYRVNKNQLTTDTFMYYLPKGTYYAACHAWVRGADSKKVFGSWSELKEFEVTATTPTRPRITNVQVKGSTVYVTYTKCKDAMGYDIVLGLQVKPVNGEKRPVQYGKLVRKVTKGNVVTAVFKDVKKGTYYAGLHAYNRTSENRKKVFSLWSNIRKVKVK